MYYVSAAFCVIQGYADFRSGIYAFTNDLAFSYRIVAAGRMVSVLSDRVMSEDFAHQTSCVRQQTLFCSWLS